MSVSSCPRICVLDVIDVRVCFVVTKLDHFKITFSSVFLQFLVFSCLPVYCHLMETIFDIYYYSNIFNINDKTEYTVDGLL